MPVSCAMTLNLATSPWGTKPSPGHLLGPTPGTSSFGGMDVPAACRSCSLPEDKGVNLGQRNSPYFYSCCHH